MPTASMGYDRPRGVRPPRDRDMELDEEPSSRKRKTGSQETGGTMRILLSVFLILLAASAAAGVAVFTGAISIAQQSAPVPSPRPATASAPAASGNQAAPQQQARVTKQETYGDWIYRCVDTGNKAVRCSISQQLSHAQTKSTVFSWRISQDGKGGLVGEWLTPRRGVVLYRNIVLDAGAPKPISIPFETCGDQMCRAMATLAPDFIESLGKAEKATATFVLTNGQPVNVSLSVKGLSDGLAALKK